MSVLLRGCIHAVFANKDFYRLVTAWSTCILMPRKKSTSVIFSHAVHPSHGKKNYQITKCVAMVMAPYTIASSVMPHTQRAPA